MKCSELLRILKQGGWFTVSQTGSHLKMKHPDKDNTLIVPNHGAKEAGKGLALRILKQAGLL